METKMLLTAFYFCGFLCEKSQLKIDDVNANTLLDLAWMAINSHHSLLIVSYIAYII